MKWSFSYNSFVNESLHITGSMPMDPKHLYKGTSLYIRLNILVLFLKLVYMYAALTYSSSLLAQIFA